MPFKSRSQLQTCYNKGASQSAASRISASQSSASQWQCDVWLRETPSVCDLPYRSPRSGTTKKRTKRINEKVVGPVLIGPRGGRYFIITEKDKRGKKCQVKVYLQ